VAAPASPGLLEALGRVVRASRGRLAWSRRELAERAGLSERFLAQVEQGVGNISLIRLAALAQALGQTTAGLIAAAEPGDLRPLALLGVRGAGKSTIGRAVATAVGARFVEVDQHIEAAAGLSLAEIFELHGEAYYRRLEQDALRQLLAERDGARLVIATGGSIVTDPTNFTWLRERCTTVWLRASTVDHWNRVVDQGDQRPMAENPHAFAELEALMATRTPLYAQADHVVDTAREGLPGAIAAVRALL
jgi:XRE family aerobic/anaerobic benzoate catabolism transcriptional regulator